MLAIRQYGTDNTNYWCLFNIHIMHEIIYIILVLVYYISVIVKISTKHKSNETHSILDPVRQDFSHYQNDLLGFLKLLHYPQFKTCKNRWRSRSCMYHFNLKICLFDKNVPGSFISTDDIRRTSEIFISL